MALADFEKIREQHLSDGSLYEDPDFPAIETSLYHSQEVPARLKWLRPHEILHSRGLAPQFFFEGASRFDIVQGNLADCWVLVAAANLTRFPDLFNKVVPPGQSFAKDWYAGVFHFAFWRFGTWIEVIIDDRLPTQDGQLLMVKAKNPEEFWGPLLEKAYAKLFRSYEAIIGGFNADSLTDFTGGVVESFNLNFARSDLARRLTVATQRNALMSTSVEGDHTNNVANDNGLVTGHAYSVTGFEKVVKGNDGSEEYLVRIRNPWGTAVEWKGRWSDNSLEWTTLSPEGRAAVRLAKDADGEFWISLDDFVQNFTGIDICNMTADSFSEAAKCWAVKVFHGEWIPGKTNGGGPTTNTYWMNPQFLVTVKDCEDSDNLASIVVELMQKNRRQLRLPYLPIAFFIHKVKDGVDVPLNKKELKKNDYCALSGQFTSKRTVTVRFDLEPGDYVIIPTTVKNNATGEFMLRVFSETENTTKSLPQAAV